ncbi:hypothetical protein J7E88_06915 [Streptomyces sp. ISL-10]|uniref:hypothetical protein n=1 Tax=Streptomyces sp. ISL-10 TaxID=2819172 RepID=UPI001BEC8EF5|nr:hypothetical protein [Streptomyces sp. ISL-10]MBT2365055.1 hypothetical protein [Streptomyces sp. ISL-10]
MVGAGLAEQNEEMDRSPPLHHLEMLTKARLRPIDGETDDPGLPTELTTQPENGSPSGLRRTTPTDVNCVDNYLGMHASGGEIAAAWVILICDTGGLAIIRSPRVKDGFVRGRGRRDTQANQAHLWSARACGVVTPVP